MRHVYCVTSFSRITLAAKNVHVHVSCFAIDPKLISVVTGRAWADWTLDSTTTRVRLSRSRERIVSLMCEHPQRTLSAAYLVNAECVNFSFIDDVKVDLINIKLRLGFTLTARLTIFVRVDASFAVTPFFILWSQLLAKLLHFSIVQ